MPHVSDVATAEAIALRNGINLAAHVGCLRIDAESDCELVIDAVKDTYRFNGSQATTIIEWVQLSCDFGQVKCPLHNRASSVADALAKQAYMLKNSSVWEDDPPNFISSLIVNDIAIV